MSRFQILIFVICCLVLMVLSLIKGPEFFRRIAYHRCYEKNDDIGKAVELKLTFGGILSRFAIPYLLLAMIAIIGGKWWNIFDFRILFLYIYIFAIWILFSPVKITIEKDGISEKRIFRKIRFWSWSKIRIHYNIFWGFHYRESDIELFFFDLKGIHIQFMYKNCIKGLECIAKYHRNKLSDSAVKKLKKMGVLFPADTKC